MNKMEQICGGDPNRVVVQRAPSSLSYSYSDWIFLRCVGAPLKRSQVLQLESLS